jgi:hypothetical protein
VRWLPPLAIGAAVLTASACGSHDAPARPAAQNAAAKPQQHRTAVVLMNFTDSTLKNPAALAKNAAKVFFGPGTSVKTYYSEASDRRVAFSGKVFGPWKFGAAAKCDTGLMRTKALEQLKAHKIDPGAYQHVSIIFPNTKAKCGWGGLGTVPGPTTWLPAEYFGNAGTIHEIGHNLGLSHQASIACKPGTLTSCKEVGYRGKATVMGGGGPLVGLTAPELTALKWFTDAQRKVVTASSTRSLVPLHAKAATPGPRIVDVPLASGQRLVLEYRRKGNTLDKQVAEGVFAYLVKGGKYARAFQIDATPATTAKGDTALKPGKTLTSGKVTVKVVSTTTQRAKVVITIKK